MNRLPRKPILTCSIERIALYPMITLFLGIFFSAELVAQQAPLDNRPNSGFKGSNRLTAPPNQAEGKPAISRKNPAQQKPRQAQQELPEFRANPNVQSRRELEEVQQLRRRFGSVRDQLPSGMNGEADQIFANEWNRLNQERQNQERQNRLALENPRKEQQRNQPQVMSPRNYTPQLVVTPNPGSTKARSSKATSAFRKAARQLEQTAAEMEEVGQYQEADELREMAKRYWQRAR